MLQNLFRASRNASSARCLAISSSSCMSNVTWSKRMICSDTAAHSEANEYSASETSQSYHLSLPQNLLLDDASVLEQEADEMTSQMEIIPPADLSLDVPVYDFLSGEATSEMYSLKEEVFKTPVRRDIVHRMILWQLANRRDGHYKGKTRGEVAGSTRKIRPQKGLGMARVGQDKVPGRRGGPKAHPPKLREWTFDLPAKVRRFAARSVLSSKLIENKLFIVDNLNVESHKVKEIKPVLEKWGIRDTSPATRALIVDRDGVSETLHLAVRNFQHIHTIGQLHASPLAMLRRQNLIITREAMDALQERVCRR